MELKTHFLCKYKSSLNQFFCMNLWGNPAALAHKTRERKRREFKWWVRSVFKAEIYMAEHKHSWFQYTCMEISWVSGNCTCSCLFSFQTSSVAPLSLLDSIPAQLTHTDLLLLKLVAHAGTHGHLFVAISLSQTSSVKLHSCVSLEIILWKPVWHSIWATWEVLSIEKGFKGRFNLEWCW